MNLDNLIDLMNLVEGKYQNQQLSLELQYCGSGKTGGWYCDIISEGDNTLTGFMLADTQDYEQVRDWLKNQLEG